MNRRQFHGHLLAFLGTLALPYVPKPRCSALWTQNSRPVLRALPHQKLFLKIHCNTAFDHIVVAATPEGSLNLSDFKGDLWTLDLVEYQGARGALFRVPTQAPLGWRPEDQAYSIHALGITRAAVWHLNARLDVLFSPFNPGY